jgi:hypothetical protein
MFVLMVAVVPPLLSDAQPSLAERAGFGDRFHYFRGRSGRRYLFTAVPAATSEDFRSAVVMLADQTAGGRLAAREILILDGEGRAAGQDRRGFAPRSNDVVLVHLLAATEVQRRRLVDEFAAEMLSLAA